MPTRRFAVLLLLAAALAPTTVQARGQEKPPPLLLQKPTLSRTQVAFAYAGDLWIVDREGGDARRLTAGVGAETDPVFSPDGSRVAFTGDYDGNVDVYVMPAAGGTPRRLTHHPDPDTAVGWTPDGRQVLFRSARLSPNRTGRLFTVSAEGGFPSALPLPMAERGSFSPDGGRLAYEPLARAFGAWKRYRGGRTSTIWIASLADSAVTRIPRESSNDYNPVWVENRVYFLSDRSGPVSLFSFEPGSGKVTAALPNSGLDLKSFQAGPDALVYEQFGALYLFDLKTSRPRRLEVRLAGDIAALRPRRENVGTRIRNAGLSPAGVRAVFEARGDIFTVPADKGDVRNLTHTPGVAERDPAWSPDGRWIACFSDASGEYALRLIPQSGRGEDRSIGLGDPPSYFYGPTWSPDSKKIAYTDKRLNLWYVDLERATPVKVDANAYDSPVRALDPVWSPDSRWIAYTRQLKNHLRAVFLYSLETAKAAQLTDGMSDCRFAAFDRSGKYLYFTASTNLGLNTAWLDMTSMDRPVTRSVYVAVLRDDLPSPLAPESDEEKVAEAPKGGVAAEAAKPAAAAERETAVRVDLQNIGQRILALPVPARDYDGMRAGKNGILFLLESTPGGGILHRFDLASRKVEKFAEGIAGMHLSANGEKILTQSGQGAAVRWSISGTGAAPKAGEGSLRADDMEADVDPRAEWAQMFREVWRIQRDFFYDPGLHGLDLRAVRERYAPYLEGVAHRTDLNYLFQEMLGELSVGHMNAVQGDIPAARAVRGGLLGADFAIENGRYRLTRVYNGENWNPQLRAPLTQPGVNVTAGDYLLAVNGIDLAATDEIYRLFEATAGKQVGLKVGPNADGSGAREVTVVPVESEAGLRNLAWIEDNRRQVERLSGGRLAYVYLPDTSTGGYTNFNRYYFAQIDRQGAVIDERFNGGGSVADYIVDYLRRPLMSWWATREGGDFATPLGAIFGPKTMIVNEYAGSGGDCLPWMFRRAKIGPLVGKRTWGGLVGIYDYPQLIDGGIVTAPRVAFYSPDGEWDVENRGVAPDVEVEMDPRAWRAGRDPQLEKAVEVTLKGLEQSPPPNAKRPAYPNYHRAGGAR